MMAFTECLSIFLIGVTENKHLLKDSQFVPEW